MGSLIRMSIGAALALVLLAVSPLAQVRKVPPSAGGAAWGTITGTLANQTDLQAALDAAGGNPFDQDLNEADDVVFASVSVGTGPFSTATQAINFGNGTFDLISRRNAANGADFVVLGIAALTDDIVLGDGSNPNLTLRADDLITLNAPVAVPDIITFEDTATFNGDADFEGDVNAETINVEVLASAASLDLNPTTDLTINGTPGVTTAGSIKGLLTDLAAFAAGLFSDATLVLPNTSLVPAVSNTSANSCGTTAATIAGNNNVGTITVGATAGTSCTMTFTITAPVEWVCTVNNATTANLARATPSSTTTSVFAGTFVAGDLLNYVCIPR